MRSRPRLIIGGVAVAALAAAGVTAVVAFGDDDRAAAMTPRTATVSTGDVTLTVSAAGNVNAVGARTLSFGASGTVRSLKVAAGDTVAKGAVLARLDAGDATDAVDSAQDSVDAAEEALATAEAAAAAAATPTAGGTSGSGAPSPGGGTGTSDSSGSRQGAAAARRPTRSSRPRSGSTTPS
ncbi:biotin/lipoyl-binding protein [Luedemannella flava]